MNSLLGLEGKAALVVGAGQGIGRACSLALAQAGCDLALVDTEKDRAEAVVAEIEALGRRAHSLIANVTERREAEALGAQALAALGRLDVLVNIVGQAQWASLLEMDEETWDREHMLNLKQHWYVTRGVVQQMIDAGTQGSVTVVASVSGLYGAPNHGAYGAAKAGLMALVKTMGEEWAPHGIRANAVAPGSVLTPRIEAMWESGEVPRPAEKVAQRLCMPSDIAGAALFLSSALAGKITGQTIVVDAGVTTKFPFDMG